MKNKRLEARPFLAYAGCFLRWAPVNQSRCSSGRVKRVGRDECSCACSLQSPSSFAMGRAGVDGRFLDKGLVSNQRFANPFYYRKDVVVRLRSLT